MIAPLETRGPPVTELAYPLFFRLLPS